MINWNDYLESLCKDYAQWWNAYTLTDVVGQQRIEQKRSPLLLDFTVQTVQSAKEERCASQEKVERLDVLAGLRKYAQEHVLLIGRPGSGKSTALARLLLEEAEKPLPQPLPEAERGANSPPSLVGKGVGGLGQIPILVELRYYQTSVLDLIRDFLKRHRLLLDTATIEQLLFDGEFLLLVDGINELPSEKARQDLYKFRQNYQKTTPMIFTTRDLGVGGDLGITKKLEMQPLTAEQMQQFVRAYLPQQGEQMLQKLGDRLREFGETPLLLWMLCSLFQPTGDIPPNLGLVFRQFTQKSYENLKQDIPVTDESRRWWTLLLEHLAFYMTKGDKLTELNVAIPRLKAEEVLTQFLQAEKFDKPRDRALEWLQDLLKHHLIQIGANDQIEFRHQLIQEYYTAECLLKQLPSLSDDCLQREYLNYLKWTEPFKLMLKLVDDEAQALRVVNLALDVDWMLGASLAGEVKQEFQARSVEFILKLELPRQLKFNLLGITRSDKALLPLQQAWNNREYDDIYGVAEALYCVGDDAAMSTLYEYEDNAVLAWSQEQYDEDLAESYLCEKVFYELENIKFLDVAAYKLFRILDNEIFCSRSRAADVLGISLLARVMDTLVNSLKCKDFRLRYYSILVLGRIGSELEVFPLLKVLAEDENYFIRYITVESLGSIGSNTAVTSLIELLNNEDYSIRAKAIEALGKIGDKNSVFPLVDALKDEIPFVRYKASEALGRIGNENVIQFLIQTLKDEDLKVRRITASALVNLLNELTLRLQFSNLRYKELPVHYSQVSNLIEIKFKYAIPLLIQLLKDEDFVVVDHGWILDQSINLLKLIQKNCKYYNYTLTQANYYPKTQTDISPSPSPKPSLMYILHLSDLHFGTLDQAKLWSNQLASDLQNELNILQLDALILSGDIANKSTPDEYAAAQQFLNELRQDFALKPEQIIIVPGNHDLNWKISEEEGYIPTLRKKYQGSINESCVIDDGGAYIAVVDPENHKRRFEHFSNFYQTIKNKPYPLDYEQQYTLDHFPKQNLLILGLNSAWQLDHHYKSRPDIKPTTLSKALTEIRRNQDYQNCIKIAVWHHPLNSASEDRITDHGFMEQLAQANFRFALHGHIHKAETSLYKYDMSASGRKLDIISAGTFGAPVWEWVSGYPLQYNLLKFADNKLTVYTRRREELNGAWKPDARWLMGAGQNPLPYYEVQL